MKKSKSFFSLLSLAILFAFNAQAADFTPKNGEPTSISKQVKSYLAGLNLNEIDDKKTVLVDFMLNSKGELMILSTNSKRFDSEIKSRLNYKAISNHNLKVNKTYTLPLKFKVS